MDEKFPGRTSLEVPLHNGDRYSPPVGGYHNVYGHDPRSSSTQSLVPSLPEYEEVQRRKLLLVYIHGFMGNDTSFQSFPAHVHKYLKLALAETHVVHTKIYPKYKTYKAIDVARDNFSKWLTPHEGPITDVVLVGHSMGGLLSADVVLMPTWDRRDPKFFQHRILGTVNLDAPLLGLHPGIIVSGISSLFRPKPDPPKPYGALAEEGSSSQIPSEIMSPSPSLYSDPSSPSVLSSPSPPSFPPPPVPALNTAMTYDPNFNPNFPNDVRLQDRGWWKNVVHFVKKHNSEGLVDAATNHIMSHLEFGSCLMDYNCLKLRYQNVRRLEDVDDVKHHGMPHVPPRVRFVQYYTVCHGIPKQPKTPKAEETSEKELTLGNMALGGDTHSAAMTPSISIQDVSTEVTRGQGQKLGNISNEDTTPLEFPEDERSSMELLDPEPMSDEYHTHGGGSPMLEHPDSVAPLAPVTSPLHIEDGDKCVGQPQEEALEAAQELSDAVNGPGDLQNEPGAPQKSSSKFVEDFSDLELEPSSNIRSRSTTASTSANPNSQPRVDSDATAAAEVADELALLTLDLLLIPDLPERPVAPDLDKYTDKDARKQAEKEAKRVQKAYSNAVKDRDKAIKERQKIIEKRRKKRATEAEKREKEAQRQRKKEAAASAAATSLTLGEHNTIGDAAAAAAYSPQETLSKASTCHEASFSQLPTPLTQETSRTSVDSRLMLPPTGETARSDDKEPEKPPKTPKPLKERKFCMLPSKTNGQMDPKWVKIFMKDVDEVGAHTGLFFPGPHYEKLVGDVSDMIVSWVQEDATKRAILAMT